MVQWSTPESIAFKIMELIIRTPIERELLDVVNAWSLYCSIQAGKLMSQCDAQMLPPHHRLEQSILCIAVPCDQGDCHCSWWIGGQLLKHFTYLHTGVACFYHFFSGARVATCKRQSSSGKCLHSDLVLCVFQYIYIYYLPRNAENRGGHRSNGCVQFLPPLPCCLTCSGDSDFLPLLNAVAPPSQFCRITLSRQETPNRVGGGGEGGGGGG